MTPLIKRGLLLVVRSDAGARLHALGGSRGSSAPDEETKAWPGDQQEDGHGSHATSRRSSAALDRPTSVAFTRHAAFVVTLTGKLLKVDGIAPRHGHR
jgi:hypothetical protein